MSRCLAPLIGGSAVGWRRRHAARLRLRSIEENGSALPLAVEREEKLITMRVAVDGFANPGSEISEVKVLQVPDPCTVDIQLDGGLIRKDAGGLAESGRSYATAELQRRNRELAKANLTIQSKDKEIRELRQSLTETQRLIQKLGADRKNYRQKLQEKDVRINNAYESLLHVAKERAELREEVLQLEQELLDVYSTDILADGNPDFQTTETEDPLRLPSGDESSEDVTSQIVAPATGAEQQESMNESQSNPSLKEVMSKRLHRLSLLSGQLLNDAEEDKSQLS